MRCGRNKSPVGWAAVITGTVILLALILPRWFWWLACGAALLIGGIVLIRK